MARTTRLDHDALDRLLIQQLDVISRRQALAVGVTDNALRHRLRLGGPWRGLLPGVYMAANGAPTTLQQEMAALLYAGPGSVITGPAALRSHHIRIELTEFGQGSAKGSTLFREALADVADGIRSAAEGDLRDLLARSGLPMPLFNPWLYDEHGNFVARPDAWWPELGIAVEVDSKQWHTSPEDHAKTLARGRRMARHQIVVLRFTPRQIRTQPAEVINDIKAALDGARGRPPIKLETIKANKGAAA
jgi:hypothetical protein